jgi:hypothetical protein
MIIQGKKIKKDVIYFPIDKTPFKIF